jgi:ribonuclease HI
MMASSSDPISNNIERVRDSSKRRKKKKIKSNNDISKNKDEITQWKSETQQHVYSSKLLQALRHVRISSGVALKSTPHRGRAVREAADRVLAVTAKGRTRWSRAILTNKLKLKFMKKNKRQKGSIVTPTSNSRIKKPRVSILRLKTKNLPAVQRKTRVLGRLVPGCRKQSLPVVLEEAGDYIAALEMQVKAMAALAQLLSGGSSSSSGATGDMISSHRQPPPSL